MEISNSFIYIGEAAYKLVKVYYFFGIKYKSKIKYTFLAFVFKKYNPIILYG